MMLVLEAIMQNKIIVVVVVVSIKHYCTTITTIDTETLLEKCVYDNHKIYLQ